MDTSARALPVAREGADHTFRWARLLAGLGVGALVLGACYLMLVRGQAIVLDLSAMSKYLLCF